MFNEWCLLFGAYTKPDIRKTAVKVVMTLLFYRQSRYPHNPRLAAQTTKRGPTGPPGGRLGCGRQAGAWPGWSRVAGAVHKAVGYVGNGGLQRFDPVGENQIKSLATRGRSLSWLFDLGTQQYMKHANSLI